MDLDMGQYNGHEVHIGNVKAAGAGERNPKGKR